MKKEYKIYYGIVLGILLLASATVVVGIPFAKQTYPGNYLISKSYATQIGPSANLQWQNAMAWARENTSKDSLFAHWWDYGYFVQTMGERATVSDGGRSQGELVDHYVGRYILTTPNPKTAMSFMKTWGVDYLLIDPTEMGKYGAFSKIGSNDSWDRVSTGIFGGFVDERQTQETREEIVKVYQLSGGCVDSDIVYSDNGTNIFLPGISVSKTQQMQCNSILGAIVIKINAEGDLVQIAQPEGIYVYNSRQYKIPFRYLFINGEMKDFGSGIEAVAYIIPAITDKGALDRLGGIIYLSPRTFNSLMGRLYILGDPYNEYPTLTEALFENDPVVTQINSIFGEDVGEFVWYQGIRAPLKIWDVKYPQETETYEEFKRQHFATEGDFGKMDGYFE